MTPDTRELINRSDDAVTLLKTLAHPVRLVICCELRRKELSVGEIETDLGIKQPRLSRELAKLRDEGLVETRRESRAVIYRLSDIPRVRAMIDAICAVMLDKPGTQHLPDRPHKRRNPEGGYGVFARTSR